MQDTRWLRLKGRLIDRGWTSHDDALYAPHQTMWFSRSSEDANMASFRDRMTRAARAAAAFVDLDHDHADLHDDLASLVEALDEVLDDAVANRAAAN